MLSVPTLWTVLVINFLALGLIWAYVMHSYPAFAPARFWTGSSFVAAAGPAVATLRVVMTDSLVPLIFAGAAMIFAIWIATMGIQKFFDRPLTWRLFLLVPGSGVASLVFFPLYSDIPTGPFAVFPIPLCPPPVLVLLLPRGPADRHRPGPVHVGIQAKARPAGEKAIKQVMLQQWLGDGGGLTIRGRHDDEFEDVLHVPGMGRAA